MSEVVKFLEAIAGWRESLPDCSGGGRHTLLSLMDSMAEVPPIRSSDSMLTSLVGPSELPAVRGRILSRSGVRYWTSKAL